MGQARASATEALGLAEATAIGKKMQAEAEGLNTKFDAMGKMSHEARSHEEYRMALETSLQQALASIEAGKAVSESNAQTIASALKNARIDLVGGDGGIFENLTKAVSLGKAVEGFTEKSPLVQQLLDQYLGVKVPTRERPGDLELEEQPAALVRPTENKPEVVGTD